MRGNNSQEKYFSNKCTTVDLIRAMFPGGTITGCPKIRCMEIIEELEPVRRSLFYGSCGYLDRRGNLDLNILIRTLLVASKVNKSFHPLVTSDITPYDLVNSIQSGANLHNPNFNYVWGQVGAGIVADSNPNKEWNESLQKAQALFKALQTV